MDDDTPKHRPSVSQLSKTPSWVMLGFILGALVVWTLPRKEPPARTIVVQAVPSKPAVPIESPLLTTVEAVFARWSDYAVWDHDLTQIAMWNSSVGEFAEYYEVLRTGGSYYFRSIPDLTHRVIRHGKPVPTECPLRFTETEEQYREWREQGRYERPPERTGVLPPRPTRVTPTPKVDMQPMTPIQPAVEMRSDPAQVEKPVIEPPPSK